MLGAEEVTRSVFAEFKVLGFITHARVIGAFAMSFISGKRRTPFNMDVLN